MIDLDSYQRQAEEGELHVRQVLALIAELRVARSSPDAPHTDGGARALDASEALREARIAGMREGMEIARAYLPYERTWLARADVDAAIEAVRRGER